MLTTIAIGNQYYSDWYEYAYPNWSAYCHKYNLGLVVFDEDLISPDNKYWKKATWQKMLLGEMLGKVYPEINNVCYLDTDILINPFAPDIFKEYDSTKIGLVSLRKNLPFPYDDVLRRMAFLRHHYFEGNYPLDSALFISTENLYDFHGLPPVDDEACMGLIVFNAQNHSALMRKWFEKYDKDVESMTNGGDQTHVNWEIQNWGNVQWLDYRFQAIWVFEMAWKFPFLYPRLDDVNLVKDCIEACLYNNYFLHFAGSWHESKLWKTSDILQGASKIELENYMGYLEQPVTGKPLGTIKPEDKKK